jgi:hypothetical protein
MDVIGISEIIVNLAKACEAGGNFSSTMSTAQADKEYSEARANSEKEKITSEREIGEKEKNIGEFYANATKIIEDLQKEVKDLEARMIAEEDEKKYSRLESIYQTKVQALAVALAGTNSANS